RLQVSLGALPATGAGETALQDQALGHDGGVGTNASGNLQRSELAHYTGLEPPSESEELRGIRGCGDNRGVPVRGRHAAGGDRAWPLRDERPHGRAASEYAELPADGDHGLLKALFEGVGRDARRPAKGAQRIPGELRDGNEQRSFLGPQDMEENRAARQTKLAVHLFVRRDLNGARGWWRRHDLDLGPAPLHVVAAGDRAYNQER